MDTAKGQSEVSVLKDIYIYIYIYTYKRGHHDDITFMTPLTVLSVAAKTRLTIVFKLHLSSLIHSTKTLFFSTIKNCRYQLHMYSHTEISVLR